MSHPAQWMLDMEPAYLDAKIGWNDTAEEVFYDVLEASSMDQLSTYLAICESFEHFSKKCYAISPPVLSLHFPAGHADVAQVLLAVLTDIYKYGGRVYRLNMRCLKWGLPVCQHVAKLATQYSRKSQFLTLEGMCRTDSQVAACFPPVSARVRPTASVACMCTSLDVSGNKLRDSSLKVILEALKRENCIASLCLDGSDVGNAACTVLCAWLQSPQCSLRDLSVRDCGIFSCRPGSAQRSTNAEKIAEAISSGGGGSGSLTSVIFGVVPSSIRAGGGAILARTIALLKGNSALRSLALDGCVDLAEEHVRHLGYMLTSTMSSLVNLDLSYCGMGNADLSRLCCELHGESGSRCLSLNLAGNHFSDLTPLLSLVNNRLRLLNLSGNRFYSEATREVSPFPTEEEAERAAVRYTTARNLGLNQFLDGVARSHCLKHLNMDNCQLSPTNVMVLFTRLAMRWSLCPSPADAKKGKGNKKEGGDGLAIIGAGETPLSYLSMNINPLGVRGIGFIATIMSRYCSCHNLRHMCLQKTLGGKSYKALLQDFLDVDRRLLALELSAEDLSRADEGLRGQLLLAAVPAGSGAEGAAELAALPADTEMPVMLASICEQPQPVITTVSVPMHKKLAIISALRLQRTGRLLLPSDCIYTILQFMRTPVRRRLKVV